jgi:hypothetical protein
LSHDWIADTNFFQLLDAEDARIAAAVKAANCPDCGGRLDQANYPRKPRGGEIGAAGEIFDRRRSFSCCREGCRHRRTPASLVFLGRRVYLAVTVVMLALRAAVTVAVPPPASPPRRTLRRWLAWFAFERIRCMNGVLPKRRVAPQDGGDGRCSSVEEASRGVASERADGSRVLRRAGPGAELAALLDVSPAA